MKDLVISNVETPQYHLANHPITLELAERGVTDEQLEAMRFRRTSRDRPFDQWSITWGNGTPLEAIPSIQAYCTLKWLILEDPPHSRDKEDAWRLVRETIIAPVFALGLKHKEAQRQRAQRSRIRVTDDGQTNKQIVERLVLNLEHRESTALELWPHFFAEMDRLGLQPAEIEHLDVRKHRYEYCFNGKRGKISYGQFANVVSEIRKKSGQPG